jgi:hypothetical protein
MNTRQIGYFSFIEEVTLKDIASWCEVDIKTVRRWVDKLSTGDRQDVQGLDDIKIKCYEAGVQGRAVSLTLSEAFQVIAAGKGDNFVNTLKENALLKTVSTQSKPRTARLPSGAQMNAMCWIYGKTEAARRIDHAMGYHPATPLAIAERICPQAYAVEMKNREKQESRQTIKAMTPELGL